MRFLHTHPPGGFPSGITDRAVDARDWSLGAESAEMIDATLAAWHRLLLAMHVAWERLTDAERLRVEALPEDAD